MWGSLSKKDTMEEICLREHSKKAGHPRNGPRRLAVHKFLMQTPTVKLDVSQVFPCRKEGRSGTDGYPSDDFHNKGHTRTPLHRGRPRDPTDPSNTINVNRNIMEAIKYVLIIFQVAYQVIFRLDIPAFTHAVLTKREG